MTPRCVSAGQFPESAFIGPVEVADRCESGSPAHGQAAGVEQRDGAAQCRHNLPRPGPLHDEVEQPGAKPETGRVGMNTEPHVKNLGRWFSPTYACLGAEHGQHDELAVLIDGRVVALPESVRVRNSSRCSGLPLWRSKSGA